MLDIYIAEVAALIGNPARTNMLCALKDDGVLTATELARIGGVAPNTASEHLAKMMQARMIAVERQGRHRYYRLACGEVADALEALGAIAANAAPRHQLEDPQDRPLRFARTCYDHLAGNLGVELNSSLVSLGYLKSTNNGFVLGKKGEAAVADFGIDVAALRARRRRFIGHCVDLSEQRPHLGGALGASLFARLRELGWLEPDKGTRAVLVTRRGRQGFRDSFQIEV
jgi:DNA-binding transcriptional ArsR family regulator